MLMTLERRGVPIRWIILLRRIFELAANVEAELVRLDSIRIMVCIKIITVGELSISGADKSAGRIDPRKRRRRRRRRRRKRRAVNLR